MFVSGWKWKTRKIMISSPVPPYESLVSIKENTDRKRKKERKKEKNMDKTQTKLNAPHIMYNIIPIINNSRDIEMMQVMNWTYFFSIKSKIIFYDKPLMHK